MERGHKPPNLYCCIKRTCSYGTQYTYSSASISTGNAFQDLPRLHETTDKTELYTVDPRVTTGLTYEQLGLRPKF
jgi:hypothetical protein